MGIRMPTLQRNYKISDEIMCKISGTQETLINSNDDDDDNECRLSLIATQQRWSLGIEGISQRHKLQKE